MNLKLILAASAALALHASRAAEWIAGPYAPPPETDTAAFFADAPADVVSTAFETADKPVAKAVWKVAAPGMRDLFVNGTRVSPTALPPWTPYRKRILVEDFDVTPRIRRGARNELRVELGNGWWNPLPLPMWYAIDIRKHLATGTPCVNAVLEIAYADGTRQNVETGPGWSAGSGRIVRNSIYTGVREDARLPSAPTGSARVVPGPTGRMTPAGDFPKIVVYDRWTAKSVIPCVVPPGEPPRWLVDMGVNFAGTLRVRLRGVPAGTEVRFRQGELKNDIDDTVNGMTAVAGQVKCVERGPLFGIAEQCDSWISAGADEAVFEPRFTFHVFRYVQVEGLAERPAPEDFEALAWSADVREAAHFECSDPTLNRIHEMCRRTFRANLQSVQSDCPGREKFGYGGDVAATAESFRCNWAMLPFYRKVVRDFLDEAEDTGLFTETAPMVGIGISPVIPAKEIGGACTGPMGWSLGVPVILDVLLRYDGETDLIREAYPALVRYIDIVSKRYPDDDIPPCLGDWIAEQKADERLTALAHWHEFLSKTARFAAILGKSDDAERLNGHAAHVKRLFRKRYIPDDVGYAGPGRIHTGKQGEQLFALYHDLVPDAIRPFALQWLKDDLHSRGDALTVGLFATQYLFETLSAMGDPGLAGRVALHEGFPGYRFMIERDATTLWEVWTDEKSLDSHCHPMLGSVEQWLMRYVLGIRVCADAIGCDRVIIAPNAVCGLTSASGWLDTPKGRISVSWKIVDGRMSVEKTLPPGVTDLNNRSTRHEADR